MRAGLYPTAKNFKPDCWKKFLNSPIIDFIRNANIIFLNKDAIGVYDEYKVKKNCLIFLDPPYLSSVNSWYSDPTINIYEHLMDNDINREKATILICLENFWVIRLLFRGKKFIVYDKKYEISKKKTEHILIINKKELKK